MKLHPLLPKPLFEVSTTQSTLLRELFAIRGRPRYIRSDNGPEFIAKAVRSWLAENEVGPLYIEPGAPWEDAFGESFNGWLRDECLS